MSVRRSERTQNETVRGYGLGLDLTETDTAARIYWLGGSPVLSVGKTEHSGKRRRLGLVEWYGKTPPQPHASRGVADIFCVDWRTADYVRNAVQEKIERDKPQPVDLSHPQRFQIIDTDVSSDGPCTTLSLSCRGLETGAVCNLLIPLESADYETQQRGQRELAQLAAVLGISVLDDADILIGRRATVVECDTGGLVFGPVRIERATA